MFNSIFKNVFPPVDADSNVDNIENPIQEVLEVDKKKKKQKQKVGFRDRKVLKSLNLIIIGFISIYLMIKY